VRTGLQRDGEAGSCRRPPRRIGDRTAEGQRQADGRCFGEPDADRSSGSAGRGPRIEQVEDATVRPPVAGLTLDAVHSEAVTVRRAHPLDHHTIVVLHTVRVRDESDPDHCGADERAQTPCHGLRT
jgi:hypothetical protein